MFVERAGGSGWLSVRRAMFVERARGSGSPSVRRAMCCWKSSELFSEQEANNPPDGGRISTAPLYKHGPPDGAPFAYYF